jgi:hypothetical protein
MTLRARQNVGGKIKEGASYQPEKKELRDVRKEMESLAPSLVETARLEGENKYTISFDAKKFNSNLDREFKILRGKVGLSFDYYIGNDIKAKEDKDISAFPLARHKTEKRLFMEFSPKENTDWAYIRGIFGLPSEITDEVSEEENFDTGDE